MPYKDKEKQREAVRKAVNKRRGITEGITPKVLQGITNAKVDNVLKIAGVKREVLESNWWEGNQMTEGEVIEAMTEYLNRRHYRVVKEIPASLGGRYSFKSEFPEYNPKRK